MSPVSGFVKLKPKLCANYAIPTGMVCSRNTSNNKPFLEVVSLQPPVFDRGFSFCLES